MRPTACLCTSNSFPEILEEIQGVADGQKCAAEPLRAFLFSMYAMPPACHCSCFAVAGGDKVLFGRNSDFLVSLENTNTNAIYRFWVKPSTLPAILRPLLRWRTA